MRALYTHSGVFFFAFFPFLFRVKGILSRVSRYHACECGIEWISIFVQWYVQVLCKQSHLEYLFLTVIPFHFSIFIFRKDLLVQYCNWYDILFRFASFGAWPILNFNWVSLIILVDDGFEFRIKTCFFIHLKRY